MSAFFWKILAVACIGQALKRGQDPNSVRRRPNNRRFLIFITKFVGGLMVAVWLLSMIGSAFAEDRTYQDPIGRNVGRSSTNSQGTTTFYDAMGRNTGRSTTSSNTTIVYDRMGRQTGTIRSR